MFWTSLFSYPRKNSSTIVILPIEQFSQLCRTLILSHFIILYLWNELNLVSSSLFKMNDSILSIQEPHFENDDRDDYASGSRTRESMAISKPLQDVFNQLLILKGPSIQLRKRPTNARYLINQANSALEIDLNPTQDKSYTDVIRTYSFPGKNAHEAWMFSKGSYIDTTRENVNESILTAWILPHAAVTLRILGIVLDALQNGQVISKR